MKLITVICIHYCRSTNTNIESSEYRGVFKVLASKCFKGICVIRFKRWKLKFGVFSSLFHRNQGLLTILFCSAFKNHSRSHRSRLKCVWMYARNAQYIFTWTQRTAFLLFLNLCARKRSSYFLFLNPFWSLHSLSVFRFLVRTHNFFFILPQRKPYFRSMANTTAIRFVLIYNDL